MRYVWDRGATGFGVSADVAGQALAALTEVAGDRPVTARMVVDAARPAEAPLHPAFTWDDVRAAELYRETEARLLIRSVRVVEDAQAEAAPARVYVAVQQQLGADVQRGYVPVTRAMSDPSLREQVIETARRDLRAFVARYQEFAELSSIGREALQQLDLLTQTTI